MPAIATFSARALPPGAKRSQCSDGYFPDGMLMWSRAGGVRP